MVQEFSPRRSHAGYLQEALAQPLAQGLNEFVANWSVQKDIQKVMDDPKLKDAPLSERQSALQLALTPHGDRGAKFFQQRLGIEQQKQQEQAVEKLKNLNTSGKSPQEVIATYYEALQGHPKAGEIISAALPYALSKTTSEQTGTGLGQSAANIFNLPGQSGQMPAREVVQAPYKPGYSPVSESPIPQKQQDIVTSKTKLNSGDIDSQSNQYLNELRPDLIPGNTTYGNVPTFDFQSKSDLRSDEEARIRQDLTAKNVLPQVQDQIVNRLREDIKTRFNEATNRYNITKDQQDAIDKKWSTFRADAIGNQEKPGRLSPYLSQFQTSDNQPLMNTQQDLMNKYFQYASKSLTNLNPDQMHAQSMTLLQNDINRLNALKAMPAAPPIRQVSDAEGYIKNLSKAYSPLAREGFTESLKEDALYNKDLGIEEFHKALWGDQTNKDSLNKVYNVKLPTRKGQFGEEIKLPGYEKNYTKQLSQALKDIKPNDDLILLRSQVLANKGTEKDFNDALEMAMEQGLKLSPFQNAQLQEVRIPRQRPVWEFFTPGGWTALQKYIRGVR